MEYPVTWEWYYSSQNLSHSRLFCEIFLTRWLIILLNIFTVMSCTTHSCCCCWRWYTHSCWLCTCCCSNMATFLFCISSCDNHLKLLQGCGSFLLWRHQQLSLSPLAWRVAFSLLVFSQAWNLVVSCSWPASSGCVLELKPSQQRTGLIHLGQSEQEKVVLLECVRNGISWSLSRWLSNVLLNFREGLLNLLLMNIIWPPHSVQ